MSSMPFIFKKIATPLVLLSFLTMALFSFFSMTSGPDGRMQGDCPFSNIGTSFCPSNALPGVIHHLSAYQSFLNAPLNPVAILLILVSVAFIFLYYLLFHIPLIPPISLSYISPPLASHNRKIKRWLSLFENSPSAN